MKKSLDLPTLNRKIFPNIVIIGNTASGKTTVAYQLARILGFGVFDLDARIEAKLGRSIAEIFETEGEAFFRQLETDMLRSLAPILNHIIIPGGGAIESDENWELLRQLGPMICLATPQSEVIYRLLKNPEELEKRPMLAAALSVSDPKERQSVLESRLNELEVRREPRYKAADYAVTISFATAGTCAQFIKEILLERQIPQNT